MNGPCRKIYFKFHKIKSDPDFRSNQTNNKRKQLTHLLQAAASHWTEGLLEPGCSKHHHTDTNQPGQMAERSHSLATSPKRTVHNRKRHFRMKQELCNRVVKEKKQLTKKHVSQWKVLKMCCFQRCIIGIFDSTCTDNWNFFHKSSGMVFLSDSRSSTKLLKFHKRDEVWQHFYTYMQVKLHNYWNAQKHGENYRTWY